MNKKIAYIITTYPCASEIFIRNEVSLLMENGFQILLLAAVSQADISAVAGIQCRYVSGIFSVQSLMSVFHCIISEPKLFMRIIYAIVWYGLHNLYEGLSLIWNTPRLCQCAKIIKEEGISHIHSAFLSWPGRMGCVLSMAMGCSLSLSAHARDAYVEGGAIRFKVQQAGFITCCSKAVADYIRLRVRGADSSKIVNIYHGSLMSENTLFKNTSLPSNPTIIAIGRFVEKKGFPVLLRAFYDVIQKCPECNLVLVGDGPDYLYVENIVKNYHLSQKVRLTGWLSHTEVMAIFAQADILVVPSVIDENNDQDGVPNVIPEAFMMGVPVIASGLKAILEAVIHEETGLIVKAGCSEDLSRAILRMLDNNSLRITVITKAYQLFCQKYDAKKNIKHLCQCFHKICV